MISERLGSGAYARVVQRIVRYSSAEVTLGIFAQMRPDDERRAVESLRSLEHAAPDIEVRATGTETSAGEKLATSWANPHAEQCSQLQLGEGAIPTGAAVSGPPERAE